MSPILPEQVCRSVHFRWFHPESDSKLFFPYFSLLVDQVLHPEASGRASRTTADSSSSEVSDLMKVLSAL
jgi:hypothetical protein